MRHTIGTAKLWILGVALIAWLTGMSSTALAQTFTVTYSLDDVWLLPDISHPKAQPQEMTGSFEWTYVEGDFENGSGQFIDLDTPWYNPGIADLNITIEPKSIEFSLKGNYHDRGFDMTLVFLTPLSPDLPSGIDTVLSKFDIQYGISYQGHVVSGTIVPDFPLLVDAHTISAASGGTVNFSLEATTDNANRNYFLLGSVTGTDPGLPLPGGVATLPLNWDVFTGFIFKMSGSPALDGFTGNLDAAGSADATLNTFGPLPPVTVGVTMYFAYLLYSPFDFVSNPVEIEITP